MRGIDKLYKEIVSKEGHKFLGFVKADTLRFLEELWGTDLGVSVRESRGKQPRSARPFIGWFEGETLKLCFLTRKMKCFGIDVRNCKKIDRKCFWIQEFGFIFFDYKRKGCFLYSLNDVLIDYVFCGRCDNLEFLERLRVIEV